MVLSHLADASTLKREVVDGVDIMIVRELVGGIYFGQPRVCPSHASVNGPRSSLRHVLCYHGVLILLFLTAGLQDK